MVRIPYETLRNILGKGKKREEKSWAEGKRT
jgi:hypothetical protein